MGALYQGLIVTGVLSVPALWWVIHTLAPDSMTVAAGTLTEKTFGADQLFYCGLVGLVVTAPDRGDHRVLHRHGFRPVKSVAKASVSGHGTNVIQGLAMSLESTAAPALVIIAGIIVTFNLAGLFGIAIAVTSMLSLAGFIVALDAFGPVTDNAGGIAEMAGLPPEVRVTTDALDAVGQHHQGGHQGLRHRFGRPGRPGALRRLHRGPEVLRRQRHAGLVLRRPGRGRLRPLQPRTWSWAAVRGSAALPVRRHVDDRRGPGCGSGGGGSPPQFRENPGIMTGEVKPEYGRAVGILTTAAIREMIVPSLLPVVSPVLLFFVINAIAGKVNGFASSAPC
jgi:K(+)-stimulated pyrophosphate-energized sodium pump